MVKASSSNVSNKTMTKKKCRFNLRHVIKHIPQGKRTKNNKENNQTQVLRSALIRVLKRFESDEDSIMRVDGVLQANLVSGVDPAAHDNDFWPSSYVKLYRLSSRWKGALLVKASRGEISVSLLKALLKKDDQVVESMFSLFTQTNDKTYLPRICLDKRVCERFFLRRIEQCGNRWSGWVKSAVKGDQVQWAKGGAYRLHWENERATKISHVSGAQVDLPSHSVVGPEFEFKYPHSDDCAVLISPDGITRIDIKKLFADGIGPHVHAIPIDDKAASKDCTYAKLEATMVAETEEEERKVAEARAQNKAVGEGDTVANEGMFADFESEMKKERARKAAAKARARAKQLALKKERTLVGGAEARKKSS